MLNTAKNHKALLIMTDWELLSCFFSWQKNVTAQSKLTSNSLFLKYVTAVFSRNKNVQLTCKPIINVGLLLKAWKIVGVGILIHKILVIALNIVYI